MTSVSASVVAKVSTRMATVFTCLSSAAYSRVSFMASLTIVSATEASSHFCSWRRLATACSFRRRPLVDDKTPSEKESQCQLTNGDHDSPMRAGPARAKRRGTCHWAIRATNKAKEALRMLSGKDGRSFLAGRRMSASRVKGKEKVGFQCSSVLVRSGLSRASCFVV